MRMISKKNNDTYIEFITVGITLFIIGLIYVYKLTNSSLWYDEAIEYWYSKKLCGKVPGGMETGTMYERICETYQPPLYNVLLFLWIHISDSEWWLRFLGVVVSLVGALGMYATIRLITPRKWALLSTSVYAVSYRVVYYTQECAEYYLLLCMIIWAVYFFIKVLTEFSHKNIFLFCLLCTLAVYSQYGAVFVVLGLAISLLVISGRYYKEYFRTLFISYITTFLTMAVPLIVLFLYPQMQKQGSWTTNRGIIFKDNLCFDLFYAFLDTLKWILYPFFDFFSLKRSIIIGALLAFCIIGLLIWTIFVNKNKVGLAITLANTLSWFAYYIAVKTKFYSFTDYGEGFGNRWALFFYPYLVISFSILLFCFSDKYNIINRKIYKMLLGGISLIWILCNLFIVEPNWTKDDVRECVSALKVEDGETFVLVHQWTEAGLHYYLQDSIHSNTKVVNLGSRFGEMNSDEILTIFDDKLCSRWPERFYYIGPTNVTYYNIKDAISGTGYNCFEMYTGATGLLKCEKNLDTEEK